MGNSLIPACDRLVVDPLAIPLKRRLLILYATERPPATRMFSCAEYNFAAQNTFSVHCNTCNVSALELEPRKREKKSSAMLPVSSFCLGWRHRPWDCTSVFYRKTGFLRAEN